MLVDRVGVRTMADSLPWSCRRGDSSQVERERGLEGSHKTPLIFWANSFKIMTFYLFGSHKIREFF